MYLPGRVKVVVCLERVYAVARICMREKGHNPPGETSTKQDKDREEDRHMDQQSCIIMVVGKPNRHNLKLARLMSSWSGRGRCFICPLRFVAGSSHNM